jgi:hypothetical protein
MDFLKVLNDQLPRDERKIEQICPSFDMDCVDLNHESCWRGNPGIMPCCGLEVEFEKEHSICPFLWLKQE